jgi:hypothetical protein
VLVVVLRLLPRVARIVPGQLVPLRCHCGTVKLRIRPVGWLGTRIPERREAPRPFRHS